MQLNKGLVGDDYNQDAIESSPVQWSNIGNKIDNKLTSAGRDGRGGAPQGRQMVAHGQTPTPGGFDICCPNCQARGDFLQ